jgi:hypothetical protein
MAYQKILVDNITCSRRFHITFDDAAEEMPRVEIRCQFCDAVIFAESNHAPVTLAREENLVKTAYLSENITTECKFEDVLSKRTQPEAQEGNKAP